MGERLRRVGQSLAAIAIGRSPYLHQDAARAALATAAGRVVPHDEMVEMSDAFWRRQQDLAAEAHNRMQRDLAADPDFEPNVTTSEEEMEAEASEEESLADDPVTEAELNELRRRL